MKFMKLGSRPDTFFTSEAVRSVASEISSDIIIQVQGGRYLLHKFPLLSKCLCLQNLCLECPESSQLQIVQLPDFPGGLEAFEICVKFCYGMTITLSAHNIVPTRCAAEYLQMTEDAEKGNLIFKIEVFFSSCILHGWKDSILALQSTNAFSMWSENLGMTGRCIEAIASKASANPSKVNLTQGYSRNGHRHKPSSSRGWWAKDVAKLEIDLYRRTMIAIKAGGKVPASLIGDSLRIYASRWLQNVSKYIIKGESDSELDLSAEEVSKHRLLLESIVSLLPADKSAVSCSFLLKLLKAANILKASSSTKMELATRVGIQLEEATVGDLLVPSLSSKNGMVYDVDIIQTILELFMLQGKSPPTSPSRVKKNLVRRRSRSEENISLEYQESRSSYSAKLKVAKLVDRYLQAIAREKYLPLLKFIAIAQAIPEFSRLDHDDLYKAVDIYLKEHPELTKGERKYLCGVLDCKKLSMEACIHAAQNEMLPLRVVVQVLFFEQARAAVAGGQMHEVKTLLSAHKNPPKHAAAFNTNTSTPQEDGRSMSGRRLANSDESKQKTKLAEVNNLNDDIPNKMEKSSKFIVPDRPRRLIGKFWSISGSASEKS